MNADGTGLLDATNTGRRFTQNPADDLNPSWSPDGTKTAFMRVVPGVTPSSIGVMNADGGHQVDLTNGVAQDLFPDWSPDGSKIAFTSAPIGGGGAAREIYTMNADGSGRTNVTNNAADDDYPSWQLLRGRVALEALGQIELKGKAEPVHAYRVLEVRSVPSRAETPLVGRERH